MQRARSACTCAGGHKALPVGMRVQKPKAGRPGTDQHAQAGDHQCPTCRGGYGDAEGNGAGDVGTAA